MKPSFALPEPFYHPSQHLTQDWRSLSPPSDVRERKERGVVVTKIMMNVVF